MTAPKLTEAQRSVLVACSSRHGLALRQTTHRNGPIFRLQERGLVVATSISGRMITWNITDAGRAALRGKS